MQDYSFNYEESDNFILNYNVMGDYIAVNYGSGRSELLEYTPQKENEILNIMRRQVRDSDDAAKYAKKQIKWSIPYLLFLIPFVEAIYTSVSGLITGDYSFSNLNFSSSLLLVSIISLPGLISYRGISDILFYNRRLYDIEKNKLFEANEFDMNMKMKVNDDYLYKVSDKTKRMIESTPKDKPLFTYNTIDKMSYYDIDRILCNIEYEKGKGMTCENKGKVRNRKK